MTKMVTLKAHRFGSQLMQPGDEFEVRGTQERRLLLALGRAKDVEPPVIAAVFQPAAKVARVANKAEVAATPPAASAVTAAPAAAPVPSVKPAVAAEPVAPAAASALPAKPAETPAKRAYNRRDMTAES